MSSSPPQPSAMTLGAALGLINSGPVEGPDSPTFLVCGFQPLHLETFLKAHLRRRQPDRQVTVQTGLYGDVAGNLLRARDSGATSAFAVLEWADLDPRLGLRSSSAWGREDEADILESCRATSELLWRRMAEVAARRPVILAAFTLPLDTGAHTVFSQAASFELILRQIAAEFLAKCGALDGVRVLNAAALDEASPRSGRLDAKMEILAGFPYTVQHAEALARLAADFLMPTAPKKGLVTDLDNTLWKGIVGEIGASEICWDVATHSQAHGLYQQMLNRLAGQGVLLAIASKNEMSSVEEAFKREDLYCARQKFFPVKANWGPKSASIEAILKAWNIGASSVVFVDDSELELAEVKAAYPEIECLHFDGKNPRATLALLRQLRNLFGKSALSGEDALRADSLRAAAVLNEDRKASDPVSFLQGLEGLVRIDYGAAERDGRPLELVNKTNQFNVNGRRVSEGDWLAWLRSPEAVVTVISYQDKYGQLGKIGVLTGRKEGTTLDVHSWVMSCRAFSRNIEHHTLDAVFRRLGVDCVRFHFQRTPKNQPIQEFLAGVVPLPDEDGFVSLPAKRWREANPLLPHRVEECEVNHD